VVDLSKIGERERLKSRKGDEPHWQRLRAGCFVGFRPSKRGGKGSWFARAYDTDAVKYSRKALGDYAGLSGHDLYFQAKRDAEDWADTVESGGVRSLDLVTVADACGSYLADKPSTIAEGVFRRHVYPDAIAKVKLDKLRRHHVRAWRKRLEEAPALVSRSKTGAVLTKARAKSTVNRDMVPLRAALRQVLKLGPPNTDAAWQEALRPFKGAEKRRDIYLDIDERRRLVGACGAEAEPFVRALCLLPLRPGVLAGLKASDFDKRTRSLTIGKDKNGQSRQISVPQSIADFLVVQIRNKLPGATIFARDDGKAWSKDKWKHPLKSAVCVAQLPGAATAYTLRHSVITDLIRSRLPALTVAQLSGTSIVMIERHYGHLVRNDADEALERLTL
jgi:integrase